MVHLFDIARQAHDGAGFDALSGQFGLGPAQTQRAVEALLPAFSLAFQRNMMNPSTFADMLGMVSSGRYAPFFDGAASPSFFPGGQGSADKLMQQLFGSPEIGRQVASQVSAVTGIGAQVLQQMMPALAATLIGGMFRHASVGGFAEFLDRWSKAIKAAVPAPRPAAPPPPQDPWTAWADVAGRMMGSGARPAPPPPPPDTPLEAWTKAIGTMLGSVPSTPASPIPDPFKAVSSMFETGREVQEQHLAQLQRIIGGAWATPARG
ncbi:DUF937 domain-containing protein [uncultured Enterovirga sp.]|uniref:DUF937 domain-containing protein n=1 Tax=uncultured Enterovirga sp. TaxID=2026352 RepID=UPI0035CC631D